MTIVVGKHCLNALMEESEGDKENLQFYKV